MNDRAEIGDEELGDRARAGDTGAYAELWSRHSRPGFVAARQFASIADPDDIVSEAYARILTAFQKGGGPHESFRPYLYRTIRNVALDWKRKAPTTVELEDVEDETSESGESLVEKTITVRAFRTLPERWQAILWYTEVEGMQPAEAAPYLGLTANTAAALAYRAREGLRKAWLQAHVSDVRVPEDCRWTTERMSDYARNALSPQARRRFESHLETCTRCSILLEEVDDLSGRLAVLLLPATLGGVAGAALLAQLMGANASSASAAEPIKVPSGRGHLVGRRVAITAAAAVVAVAGVSGAFALAGAFSPASAPEARQSAPTTPNTPEPQPTPSPTAAPDTGPALPAPAPAVPVIRVPPARTVAPPPADTTAPGAPVVTSIANGALINDATPTLVGTGEPGATVSIVRVVADGSTTLVATAIVHPDGSWSATPTANLPDGPVDLRITQSDPAGNQSPAAALSMTVDTVVAPPQVDPLPTNPMFFLPKVTGTAEPGATVELHDATGAALGAVTAASDGSWTIQLPDPGSDTEQIAAVQRDPAGNLSGPSPLSPALVFARPTIVSPVDGATIPSTNGEATVTVTLSGQPGMQVQIFIDGVWTGNLHTLGSAPIDRVTPPLPSGPHTIGVRYYDNSNGAAGSFQTIGFDVAP